MNYRINKLIEKNLELTKRVEEFETKMESFSHLYDLTPPAWCYIDRNNIIRDADDTWAKLIGFEKDGVIGKPVALYLFSEDLPIFFSYRNKVFSKGSLEIFETRFRRKEGTPVFCRVQCALTAQDSTSRDQMRLAVRDISESQHLMESMQFKDELTKLIFTVSENLNNAPIAELPSLFTHSLKLIGLFSGADRCYICQIHGRGATISNTHEWCAEKKHSKKHVLANRDIREFSRILEDMKRNTLVKVIQTDSLDDEEKSQRRMFHADGTKSVLEVPIFFGNHPVGIIGMDAVRERKTWSNEVVSLMRLISDLLLSKLIIAGNLQEQEKPVNPRPEKMAQEGAGAEAWLLEWILSNWVTTGDLPRKNDDDTTPPGSATVLYQDPDIVETGGPAKDRKRPGEKPAAARADWEFSPGEATGPAELMVLYKGETNVLSISCPLCMSTRKVSRNEIVTLGNIVKATCACGATINFKIESRKAPRKEVRLNGFFIRKASADRSQGQDLEWGDILIQDISRAGIGFILLSKHEIRKGESFKVKFTLDNTLKSVIHKEVLVKSVRDDYVGCQFTGYDRYDITLGFYLM
jgi:PAS domain S-box-containing protein